MNQARAGARSLVVCLSVLLATGSGIVGCGGGGGGGSGGGGSSPPPSSPVPPAPVVPLGPPAQIVALSGSGQSITAGQSSNALVVLVTDSTGRPVPGVAVSYGSSAGGSVSPSSVGTDGNGQGQASFFSSTAGSYTVTASAGALSTSFNIQVNAPAPSAPPPPPPPPAVATTLSETSGNGAAGKVGAALAAPFVVTVRDQNGAAFAGATVVFDVTGGGGTVGGLAQQSVVSDGAGQASALLTLGAVAGTNTVTATATGLTGSPITFTAEGRAPSTLAAISGAGQTQGIGTTLTTAFGVVVKDGANAPVPGVAVTFDVTGGGGKFGAATQVVVTTDAAGEARASLTLGLTAGANTATATVAGLTPPTVTFTATATVIAQAIALTSGDAQAGKVGTALAQPFVVTVTDGAGNPFPGYTAVFRVTAGAGTVGGLAQQSVVTDAAGKAQVTLTLGAAAGTNTVQVDATGLTNAPIVFTAEGRAPALLSLVSGDAQLGGVSQALPAQLVVKVTDAASAVVPGETVTFTISLNNGKLTGNVTTIAVTTAADGTARTTWTLGSTPGANGVNVTAAVPSGSPLALTATGLTSTPTTISVVSGDDQFYAAGFAAPAPLVVKVTDSTGAAVAGVNVSFTVVGGAGNGSLTVTSATTDGAGQASTTYTMGPTAGTLYNVQAAASNGAVPLTNSPITFDMTATQSPTTLTVTSGGGQVKNAGTTLDQPFVVTVTDAGAAAVQGVPVTFAVTGGGGDFGGASSVVVLTDEFGVAQASLKLGAAAGANTVTATAKDPGGANLTNSPATFTATALKATTIALTSGNNQLAVTNTVLPLPFVVTVTDASSTPVPGVPVTWTIVSGGGQVSSALATTDAAGQAQVTLTLGPTGGQNLVDASAKDNLGVTLGGSPVTFTATAAAGIAFWQRRDAAVAAGPAALQLADVNGDGKLDLLTVATTAARLSALLGNGNGTFNTKVDTVTGANPLDLATGDFDGDGKVDVVTVNKTGGGRGRGTFSYLRGKGDGTFFAPVNKSVGKSPSGIAAVDLNADAKLDVVVTNGNDDTVQVFLGAGNGTFAAATSFTTGNGTQPAGLAVGDLNRDGKPDLVTANSRNGGGSANTVSILLNQGGGAFGAPTTVSTGANTRPVNVTIVDLDKDTFLDVVTANGGTSLTTSFLKGNGAGGLNAGLGRAVGVIQTAVRSGDLDADGNPDVVLSLTNGTVAVLFGDGAGGLGAPAPYAVGVAPNDVAVADVTGDGKPDAVSSNQTSSTASVLVNVGGGILAGTLQLTSTGGPVAVAAGAVDATAGTDLVALNQFNSESYTTLLNRTRGAFASTTTLLTAATGPSALAMGAIDGDANQDIAVVLSATNAVDVRFGNGVGAFATVVSIAVGAGTKPVAVALLDVDGDADQDVAVACATTNEVKVFLQGAGRTFSAGPALALAASPRALVALTVGGKPAVAAACTTNEVVVVVGDGAGAFPTTLRKALGAGAGPTAIAAADLDAASGPDLVVACGTAGTALVLLADGAGDFAAAAVGATPNGGPSGVVLGDFNGDGRPDLAVVSGTAGTVTCAVGSGGGAFGLTSTFATGADPRAGAIAELSGDAKPDLAVANGNGGLVVLIQR